MDPLSISVSSLAVIGATVKVGQGLRKLVELRKAPGEVAETLSDLERLRVILRSTKDVDLDGKIEPQLRKLRQILLDIQQAVDRCLKSNQGIASEDYKVSKHRYVLEKEKIKASRAMIGLIVGEITLILNTQHADAIQNLIQMVSRLESHVSEMSKQRGELQGIESEEITSDLRTDCQQYQQQPIAKPSLLSNTLGSRENFIDEVVSGLSQSPVRLSTGVACTCRRMWSHRQNESQHILLKTVVAQSELIWRHRKDCPLFHSDDFYTKLTWKLSCLSTFLSKFAEFSLTVKYGYGGIAISPGLVLRGIARETSPALLRPLFLKHGWKEERVMAGTHAATILHRVWQELEQTFRQRQACPSEVDRYGANLFWQFESIIYNNEYVEGQSGDGKNFLEAKFAFERNLILFGVPLNEPAPEEVPGHASTVLDFLFATMFDFDFDLENYDELRLSCFVGLGHSLIAANAESNSSYFDWAGVSFMKKLLQRIDGLAEVWDIGRLSQAVIQENMSSVQIMVEKNPSLIFDEDVFGRTALGWSADSPKLLRTMLVFSEEMKGTVLSEALQLAISSNCYESVLELTERKAHVGSDALDSAALKADISIFRLVASAFARQRNEAYAFAAMNISADVLERIHPRTFSVLDGKIRQLSQHLDTTGGYLDFEHPYNVETSVYALAHLEELHAEILYSLGFNVNVISSASRVSFVPALFDWVMGKRLDLSKEIAFDQSSRFPSRKPSCGAPTIYTTVAHHMALFDGSLQCLDLYQMQAIRGVNSILSEVRIWQNDGCDCPCSPNGCNIVSQLLKGLTYHPRKIRNWPRHQNFEEDPTVNLFNNLICRGFEGSKIGPIFIRMWLFETLELPHLCCQLDYHFCLNVSMLLNHMSSPVSIEQAQALREKSSERFRLLEELVQKACQDFEISAEPIEKFMKRFVIESVLPEIRQELT